MVDFAHHIRPRQLQQVVVAFEISGVVGEALATKIGFAELVALDHRAHRAVDDHDALLQQRGQLRSSGVGTGSDKRSRHHAANCRSRTSRYRPVRPSPNRPGQ